MNILVDWLTLSIRKMELQKLLEILHLENEKMEEGYSRWLGRKLYLGGISIHYGEYIILEMSGSGCRFLESLYDNKIDWIDFIEQFLCLEGSHLARLDIACDDKPEEGEKGILSFKTIARHCIQRRYVCRSTKKPVLQQLGEESVIFGRPTSDRRLRIYNKAMERGVEGHWMRAEFQLRNEAALSYYMRALELHDIGQAYQGMLYDYLRFTREVNDFDSKNQSRLTVTRWWKTFCNNAKKIKGFYVGGLEYNLESLERYLGNQTSSSMKTYIEAHGGDVSGLLNMAQSATYNKKQEFLIKTQPLIDKMNQDYQTQEERDRKFAEIVGEDPRRLTKKEMLTMAVAHTENAHYQAKYEERFRHWNPKLSGAEVDAAWQKHLDEVEEMAAEDLPFD